MQKQNHPQFHQKGSFRIAKAMAIKMVNHKFMRFPGGKFKAFSMSYDDGVGTDLRLMEIMRQNGLKGTFNLNGAAPGMPDEDINIEQTPTHRMSLNQLKKYYGDFEVATHGYTHPFYRDLPQTAVIFDIVKDREVLEDLFGRIIRGHALPNGSYNKETIEALRACGIIYSRTTKATKTFDIPEDWLEYHPTAHHEHGILELADRFLAPTGRGTSPWFFCLWGHSYEFERADNWELIEEFAKKIGGHDEVYYGGMQEIVEYVNAYRSLVYSIDSRRIYNPSAIDIWITPNCLSQEIICIHAGETVEV